MKIESFCITGIAVRTTNENGAAAKDIPLLWQRFMTENCIEQIPGKINNDLFCVYTDYEKDFTKPYTTILGCKVTDTAPVPDGFTKKIIPAGDYRQFIAKGNLQEGAVFNEWATIWNTDLKRLYTADFEVYGEKASQPATAEVDIFVAVE